MDGSVAEAIEAFSAVGSGEVDGGVVIGKIYLEQVNVKFSNGQREWAHHTGTYVTQTRGVTSNRPESTEPNAEAPLKNGLW